MKSLLCLTLLVFVFTLRPVVASSTGHTSGHEAPKEVHSETHTEDAHEKTTPAEEAKPVLNRGFFSSLMDEFMSKWKVAMKLDQENEFLRGRIAGLEIENAILVHQSNRCSEKSKATIAKAEAKQEGGVEHARTISSLKPREHDLTEGSPQEIFDKASRFFESENFEASAKGFLYLLNDKQNESFKTAQVAYLSAVSLFRLNNYKSALENFEKSKTLSEHSSDRSYIPRALAWMALCYEKLGNKEQGKKIVKTLVQNFPKSPEAKKFMTESGRGHKPERATSSVH